MYNIQETGLINSVRKSSKILAQKVKHQVGAVTSGGKCDISSTCICCINTTGEFVPHMLIFKRQRMTDDLKQEGHRIRCTVV